jgi:thiol-disulfide isomerase/thioredoxin
MTPRRKFEGLTPLILRCLAVILFAATCTLAQTKTAPVTLQGQLVCSLCWFEADRKSTPYGTPADIECAIDCAEKNIPPALAVPQGDDFKLYVIDESDFQKNKTEWLSYIGKRVEIVGRPHPKKEKDYLAVERLRVLPAETNSSSQSPAVIGTEVELGLKDLFGVEQKLSSYRGKIVVLNFWATWCVPCRKEMPDLAAIQNEYAALGVQVVGAAADSMQDRPKVMQFIKETRINFPIWVGVSTADMKRFGLGPALPGTAVIGRDGKILSLNPSVITQAELKKLIDGLLAADARSVKREIASARPEPVDVSLVPS